MKSARHNLILEIIENKDIETQEELADRCELTKGYISQLENDLGYITKEALNDLDLNNIIEDQLEEKQYVSYFDLYIKDENNDYILDENDNYIIEKYASITSVENLQNQINELNSIIKNLQNQIDKLNSN
jgi:transcriptional regulator with XRE-family HTH domain